MKNMRFYVLWLAAVAVVGWYWLTDPNGGAETVVRLQWLAWVGVASGPVYLLRRALMQGARSRDAYRKALENPVGAGLVHLGLSLLTGMLFLAFASHAGAAELPAGAVKYLPVLKSEQSMYWPDAPLRSALAAQVEQETCASLKSAKCWNPRAELKTSREYGFGLGQLTVTSKFDNFSEARKLDKSLKDWDYADRYDATRQLRTMVLMDRASYRSLTKLVPDTNERFAMTLSAYNGGLGGVLQDRRLCASIAGCDPNRWFGNVEIHSLKAKGKAAGYGQSFFCVNRSYPDNIMGVRRAKYSPYFDEPVGIPRKSNLAALGCSA